VLRFWPVAIFFAAHVPLALAMKQLPKVAIAHGLLTLALGMWWAVTSRRLERVLYVAAYIVGAEVLWRMVGGKSSQPLPLEFGKYAVSLLFLTATVRHGRFHHAPLPVLYFLLLMPAAFLTLAALPWNVAQARFSFNLTGPFALAVCLIFLQRLKLSVEQLFVAFVVLMAPVVGIASICYSSTFGASSEVFFGRTSSVAAAGGFGPNQVSAILGFGVIASFICIVDERFNRKLKLLFLGCALLFGMQAALTLSRTGVYLAAGSILFASFYLVQNRKLLLNFVGVGAVGFALVYFLVLPRLDKFTGGALTERFSNTHTTGRDKILLADLQIWMEHPVLGIGVGLAREERARFYRWHNAHTEYTRLLAEHGALGLLALGVLFFIFFQAFRRARTTKGKALVVALLTFSLLYMCTSGMRMVLVCFTLGLSTVTLVVEALPNRRRAAPPPRPEPLPQPNALA
jgi:hypothetical protein